MLLVIKAPEVVRSSHQNLKFSLHFDSETEMVRHLQTVESEQKKTISDLEADIVACHNKEAELLAFSEKMTAKNAQLQSEASGTLSKVLKLAVSLIKFNALRIVALNVLSLLIL